MLSYTHLLAAACIAASTGLFVANLSADDLTINKSTVTYSPNSAMEADTPLPSGIEMKNLNADKSIEKSFKKTADNALSKNGFGDFAASVAEQDYDRIKKSTKSLKDVDGNNNKRLNDLVNNLQNVWQSKYNQKFDMDYSKVFTSDYIHISTGEVSDPNLLVDKWPVDPTLFFSSDGKMTEQDAQIAREKMFGGTVKLEKGREVAIAHILPIHGMPGIEVSMLHETASGWKMDIPNTIDAQKLYDNLVSQLEYIDQHRELLPADVNDGYREVTHAVVAALYDISPTSTFGSAKLDNGAVRPASAVDNR